MEAIKQPLDRRTVSWAALAALAIGGTGCGGGLPAPAQVVAAVPQVAAAVDKLALIADAFERTLPAVSGVASDAKATITDLREVVRNVSASATAVAASPWVGVGLDLVKKLAGSGAWGNIGTAALSLLPTIAGYVGLGQRASGRIAMSPAAAENVLRSAVAGR